MHQRGQGEAQGRLGEAGIGKGDSADVPTHEGVTSGTVCCLEFLLSEQSDFKEQQNAIQELIASRGSHCILLPKFRPELNFIERYWSRVKWYARQHSDGPKARADEALGDKGCDLALIRRYARTSWRWVDAYRSGLGGVLACWVVRKSKANQCVTDSADREANKIKEEKDTTASARASAEAAATGGATPVVLRAVAAMDAVGALGDDDED